MNIRQLIIRYITPIIWKYFPKRKLSSIQKFSYTEKDSGCRLLQYLVLIKDPAIKKELFQHVLEEFYHADLFSDLSKELSNEFTNLSIPPREYQVTEDSAYEELLSAYAYAHIGESSINKDFSAYNNKNFTRNIRAVFARVASDELNHAESTDEIFVNMCNYDLPKAKKIYFKAKIKRIFSQYSAFMKQVGEFQLNIILKIIYYLFGTFIYKNLQKRLSFSAKDQLEILKSQIAVLELSNK
jgi:hypothetical protein